MYIVKNIFGGTVMLNDIDIRLKPDEKVDLDALCDRDRLEKSTQLKRAIDKGFIEILEKSSMISPVPQPVDFEARMEEALMRHMDKMVAQPSTGDQGIAGDLVKKLDDLIDTLKNSGGKFAGVNASNEELDISEEDEGKMVDIQTRVLKRLREKVTGSVAAQRGTSDSNVDEQADEISKYL